MGIYKRGRIWHMSFLTKNGIQIRKSTNTSSNKLAKDIFAKVKSEVAEGKWLDVSTEERVTFKELTDRYMEEHSRVKKKSSKRDELSLSYLNPFFGDLTLAEVTPQLISRYKSTRLLAGAKPATLNRELALAKHAFNLALKEWEWCTVNPFSRVKMEKENNARDRVLTYGEEDSLLNACPKWLRDIVEFALNTGARMGEILELTWKDVDLFRRVVVIHQGKTEQNKTIPLTPTAMDVLKRRVRHIRTSLVFPSVNGTRITNTNLGRAFRKALKRAGIEGFRFHDLRHTFASRLAMAGKDLYVIQKLLGHREPRMVQRYAHHSVESLRSGIEGLETLKKEASEKNSITNISQSGASGENTRSELDEKLKKSYGYQLSAHSSDG